MTCIQFPSCPAPARLGLLARLRHNSAGNTIAMVGAFMVPLAAMVGSGIDMSRSYLVKTRLQAACDSGALAARKAMGGGAYSSAAASVGTNFFNSNFAPGSFGATDISFTPSATSSGQVQATATATVPMTLMSMFGNDEVNLSVECEAKIEVANTDVMFVLDVTGSMAGSRIIGLRAAVLDFYDTLLAAAPSTSQLRYGFVPYSSNVNVGGVLPDSYISDTHTYQSVVANMNTPDYPANSPTTNVTVETYGSTLTSSQCNSYGVRKSYPTNDGATFNGGGPAPTATTVTVYSKKDWGATGTTSGTYRTCRRNKTVTTTSFGPLRGYKFTSWTFRPVTYNTATFKTGATVTIANGKPNGYVPSSGDYNLLQLAQIGTASPSSTRNTSFTNKCVEERDTLAQATFSPLPAAAYDLDIDTIPTSNATRWRAMWSEIIFPRYNLPNETYANNNLNYGNAGFWCPAPARRYATMTRGEVETYVNSLVTTGNTYHDLGMAWGGRLASPTGIFAADNVDTHPGANGRPITRHLVFMTDGEMCNANGAYTSHGVEKLDRRVIGTADASSCSGESDIRHARRFSALCEAIKGKNISIWSVSFGTRLSTEMINCANPGQAFEAADSATLRAKFQLIASRIADLRIAR